MFTQDLHILIKTYEKEMREFIEKSKAIRNNQ